MSAEIANAGKLLAALAASATADERANSSQHFNALAGHIAIAAMKSRAEMSPSEVKRAVKAILESPDPAAVRLTAL